MINAVSDIPRIETKLFSKWVRNYNPHGFCFVNILLLRLLWGVFLINSFTVKAHSNTVISFQDIWNILK